MIRNTVRTQGLSGLYSGCTALMYGRSYWEYEVVHYGHKLNTFSIFHVGNALKAAVRFLSYDHFKHMLADKEVSLAY